MKKSERGSAKRGRGRGRARGAAEDQSQDPGDTYEAQGLPAPEPGPASGRASDSGGARPKKPNPGVAGKAVKVSVDELASKSVDEPHTRRAKGEKYSTQDTTVMMPFDDLLTDKFRDSFWKGRNGNKLIEFLNEGKDRPSDDRIRREKNSQSPHIYGIVVNKWFKGNEYRLVKVGFTQVSTKSDRNNRMEQVQKETDTAMKNIDPSIEKSEMLFILRKSGIDTSTHTECEMNLRLKVGIPFPKELAKKLRFPVHTEWVVAKQERLTCIREIINESENVDVSTVTKQLEKAVSEFSDETALEMKNGQKIRIDKLGNEL